MSEKPKRPRKSSAKKETVEKQKGLSLFDHIKHIQKVQDPDYFSKLTELDRKSFNHFMILRGLSMNPELLEDIAFLYKYFDTIPSPQFYTLLISLIPPEHPKAYHPWVKAPKRHKHSKGLLELLATKYEISPTEAVGYADIFNGTEANRKELFSICQGFGLSDKEVNALMSDDEN